MSLDSSYRFVTTTSCYPAIVWHRVVRYGEDGTMNKEDEELCGEVVLWTMEVVVDNEKRNLWEIVNMVLIRFKLYIYRHV